MYILTYTYSNVYEPNLILNIYESNNLEYSGVYLDLAMDP